MKEKSTMARRASAATAPATAPAITELPKPTKGVKPRMDGVPGELVDLDALNLQFGGMRKVSPYDPLLDQLATATDAAMAAVPKRPRPGLKFGHVRARNSVWARAKAKGFKVSFAIAGSDLYVRLDGRVDDDVKETRRSAIRKLLASHMQLSVIPICNKLREGGDVNVDAALVETILTQMAKAGEVIRQESGAWRLGLKGAK